MLSKLAIFLTNQYPETAKNIFWALMYFPEVKAGLKNPGLLRYVEDKCKESFSWRLGQIASCALDYQSNIRKSKISTPLTDAGLLANSFLETLEDDRWDEILNSLHRYIQSNLDEENAHFQIVCLSGFLEDPFKLAVRLIRSGSGSSLVKLAVLIICCNYFDDSVLHDHLYTLLKELAPADRIPALDFLYQTGRKVLVLSLAKILTDEIEDTADHREQLINSSAFFITKQLYEMSLWRFLQDEKKLEFSIDNLEMQLDSLQQGLMVYSVENAVDEEEYRSIQKNIVESHLSEGEDFQTLFELSSAAYQRNFSPVVPGLESSPFTKIMALKKLLLIEPREICSELAQKAIDQFEILFANDHISKAPKFIKDYGFSSVLKDLYEADFYDQTIRFGELLSQYFAINVNVMHYIAISQQRMGKNVQALELTLQESGYDPDSLEIKRRLYNLYHALDCHREAYDQFRELLESELVSSETEQIELAKLAILAGDFQNAVTVCEELIEKEIETVQIYLLLGEAQLNLENFEQAKILLEKAVALQPDAPEAYSLLAEAHRKLDQPEENLSLLEQGLALLPGSATIQIEIAKEYFQEDLISEGLPFLQNAAILPPDTRKAALDVGILLNGMGDLEGALAYYKNALNVLGFDSQIARAALLNAKELDEFAVMEDLAGRLCAGFNPEPDDYFYLLLAKLQGKNPLLSESFRVTAGEIEEINELVERALLIDADHFEINLLKAELLCYGGQYLEAREIIAEIVDRDGSSHWKYACVLGVISFHTGEYNTAVAALQESYQHNPGNVKIERYLAEANLGAGLQRDAQYFAEKVINRSPNSLPTLLWYGDIIGRLGDHRSALDAFIQANAMQPGDMEIVVKLLTALWNCGELTQTREILARLDTNVTLSTEAVQQLGQIYIYFNEWERLSCLIQVNIDAFQDQSDEILGSLSIVELKKGNIEKAFEYSQDVLDILPANIFWILYQADLLYLLDKIQAALSLVEHAEKEWRKNSQPELGFATTIANELFPAEWVSFTSNGVGIAARKILFLRKLNQNNEAVSEALLAYEEYKDAVLCCMLVGLFIEQGKFVEAQGLLNNLSGQAEPVIREAVYRLSARLYILLDKRADLDGLLKKNEFYESLSSEATCAKAIQKMAEGDWVKANEFYLEAQKILRHSVLDNETRYSRWGTEYDPIRELLVAEPFWLFETGCKLHDWDKAIEDYSKGTLENPENKAMQYGYGKALLAATEWDIYAEILNIQSHKLHIEQLNFGVASRVEKLIGDLATNRECPYTDKLKLHAELLFTKEPVQFDELVEVLSLPDDLELIAAILQRDQKHSQLKALSNRLGELFQFKWKQAICFYGSDLERGNDLAAAAANSSPNSPLSQITAAIFEDAVENTSEAYHWVQQAVKLWHDEKEWRSSAVRLAKQNNDMSGAIVYLEDLIKVNDDDAVIACELAALYNQNSQYSDSIEILNSLEKRGIVSEDTFLLLGEAYYFLEEYEKAFEYAEKAKEYNVNSVDSYMLYAKICDKLEQFDAAMSYARRALDIQPHDPSLHLFIATILEKTGNFEEALQLLENLVIANQADTDVLLMFIRLKQKLHGSQSILPLLEDLRTEIDFDEKILIDLAEAYFEVGEYEKAQREAMAVLNIQPDYSHMKIILAKINQLKGQLDLAIHYCVEAIADDPEEMDGYLTLADIYIKRREISDALGVYKQAIRVNPDNHLPYYHAGLLLRETKDYKEAEIMLKHAARLAPDGLQIRRQLGAVVALNLVHNAQEETILS